MWRNLGSLAQRLVAPDDDDENSEIGWEEEGSVLDSEAEAGELNEELDVSGSSNNIDEFAHDGDDNVEENEPGLVAEEVKEPPSQVMHEERQEDLDNELKADLENSAFVGDVEETEKGWNDDSLGLDDSTNHLNEYVEQVATVSSEKLVPAETLSRNSGGWENDNLELDESHSYQEEHVIAEDQYISQKAQATRQQVESKEIASGWKGDDNEPFDLSATPNNTAADSDKKLYFRQSKQLTTAAPESAPQQQGSIVDFDDSEITEREVAVDDQDVITKRPNEAVASSDSKHQQQGWDDEFDFDESTNHYAEMADVAELDAHFVERQGPQCHRFQQQKRSEPNALLSGTIANGDELNATSEVGEVSVVHSDIEHGIEERMKQHCLSLEQELIEERQLHQTCQMDKAYKTNQCEELMKKIAGLEHNLVQAQSESIQQATVAEQLTALHRQNVKFLEERLEAVEADRENFATELTAVQRNWQAAETELSLLRASLQQQPVAQQITVLQIQHEEDLQKQYRIIDAKSAVIRELEQACKVFELEKTALASTSLLEQLEIQEQAEQLASELLSVAAERDMLEDSLHLNLETMQHLQEEIETVGMDQSERQTKLQMDKMALQKELNHFRDEAESVKEELNVVKNENRDVLQQIEHVRLESAALKDVLQAVKLENAAPTIGLEALKETAIASIDQSERHTTLQAENTALQQELRDCMAEAESVKETLKEVKIQNGELQQQIEDVRFESVTLKEDLKAIKLVNASLTADLETAFSDASNNQVDATALQDLEFETEAVTADLKQVKEENVELAAKLKLLQTGFTAENENLTTQLASLLAAATEQERHLNEEHASVLEQLQSEKGDVETILKEAQAQNEALLSLLEKVYGDAALESAALKTQLNQERSLRESQDLTQREQHAAQLEDLRSEIASVVFQLKEMTTENLALKIQLEQTHSAHAEMKEIFNKERQQLATALENSAAAELHELQAEKSTLIAQLENVRAAHASRDVEIQDAANRERQLSAAALEELQIKADIVEIHMKDTKTENETLKAQFERVQVALEVVQREKGFLEDNIKELQSENASLRAQLEQDVANLQSRNHELEDRQLQDVSNAFKDLQLEKDSLESKLKDLMSENASLATKLTLLPAIVPSQQHNVLDVEQHISADAFDDLQLEKDLLEDDMKELQLENFALKAQLERVQTNFESKQRELLGCHTAQAELEALGQQNASLRIEMESRTREIELSYEARVRGVQSEIESLQMECARLRDLSESQKREINDFHSVVAELAEKENHAAATIESLRAEKDLILSELENAKCSSSKERDLFALSTRQQTNEFEQELIALQNRLQKLQAEYNSLKANFDNMSTDLMSKEMELEDLQERFILEVPDVVEPNDIELENVALQEQITKLTAEIETLKSTLDGDKAALLSKGKGVVDALAYQSSVSAGTVDLKEILAEKAALEVVLQSVHAELDLKVKELENLTSKIDVISKERDILIVQLQDSNATCRLAEAAAVKAVEKVESSTLEAIHKELELVTDKYHQSEAQRKQTSVHLAALGKSLKKTEETLENSEAEARNFKKKCEEFEDIAAEMAGSWRTSMGERDAAIADRDSLATKCAEMELHLSSLKDNLGKKVQDMVYRHDTETAKQNEMRSHLQAEVQRYREMEEFASSELEEAQHLAQEQARGYEESAVLLRNECDRLAQMMAHHQELNASNAQAALNQQASKDASRLKEECDRLRAEVLRLQQAEASYAQSLNEFELHSKEQSAWCESEFDNLNQEIMRYQEMEVNIDTCSQNQIDDNATPDAAALRSVCEQLSEEVSRYQNEVDTLERQSREQADRYEMELDFIRGQAPLSTSATADSERQYQDQARRLDEEVTLLKKECDNLRKESNERQSLAAELDKERACLLQERDAIIDENEEMLVQFGLIKQQMDLSDEYIRTLNEEIKSLQAKGNTGNNDLATPSSDQAHLLSKIDELEAQARSAIGELDEVASRLSMLETRSGSTNNEGAGLDKGFKEMESRYQALEGKCRDQSEQIARLNAFHARPERIGDFVDVDEKLNGLIAECRAKDQVIDSKAAEIKRLHDKFRDASEPSECEDTSENDERFRELEGKCEELSADLNSAMSQLETTEASLAAREQLLSFQAALNDLGSSAHAPGHINKLVQESENHIRHLKKELNEKNLIVDKLQCSVRDLKYQLDEADSSKENESEAAKKDAEIRLLTEQICELQAKLMSTDDQLKQIVYTKAGASAANHIKETDTLRAHIVSLALALERSENNRADAINRLVSEREPHARSLRNMSENVKRFYSTVTFGDS